MLNKLCLVAQLALGGVFLVSSASKLRDPRRFARGLTEYQVLPAGWANAAAGFVIGLEISLALAHLAGQLLTFALPLGLALLATFGVAVGLNLKRGRALPCHCFGQGSETISGATLVRLALLASGEVFLWKVHHPVYVQSIAFPELTFGMFWAAFLLAAGFWVFAAGDLISFLRSE
jgi:hypothetical protein